MKKHKAFIIGENIGKRMFGDFYNHPEYRGINFQWDTFPIENSAICTGILSMKPVSEKTTKRYEELISKASRDVWNKLCKEHNLPVKL